MLLHERARWVSTARTELELELHRYAELKRLTNEAMLQRLAWVQTGLTRSMRKGELFTPKISKLTTLDQLVAEYQREHELTNIELYQAIVDYVDRTLRYMLRYERHGRYDKPAEEA